MTRVISPLKQNNNHSCATSSAQFYETVGSFQPPQNPIHSKTKAALYRSCAPPRKSTHANDCAVPSCLSVLPRAMAPGLRHRTSACRHYVLMLNDCQCRSRSNRTVVPQAPTIPFPSPCLQKRVTNRRANRGSSEAARRTGAAPPCPE